MQRCPSIKQTQALLSIRQVSWSKSLMRLFQTMASCSPWFACSGELDAALIALAPAEIVTVPPISKPTARLLQVRKQLEHVMCSLLAAGEVASSLWLLGTPLPDPAHPSDLKTKQLERWKGVFSLCASGQHLIAFSLLSVCALPGIHISLPRLPVRGHRTCARQQVWCTPTEEAQRQPAGGAAHGPAPGLV